MWLNQGEISSDSAGVSGETGRHPATADSQRQSTELRQQLWVSPLSRYSARSQSVVSAFIYLWNPARVHVIWAFFFLPCIRMQSAYTTEPTSIDRLPMNWAIVTLGYFVPFSRYMDILVENRQFFLAHVLNLTTLCRWSGLFCNAGGVKNLSDVRTRNVKYFWRCVHSFGTIPEPDGRTDR